MCRSAFTANVVTHPSQTSIQYNVDKPPVAGKRSRSRIFRWRILMNVTDLTTFGWDEFFEANFKTYAGSGYTYGRVALEHKNLFRVYTQHGEAPAEISGKLRHEAVNRRDLPAVGDWVAIRFRPEDGRATIHAVLPRRTSFVRKLAGSRTEEQIVGANTDTVFLLTSLNHDFNLRRVERYLIIAWESGANPIIILSKSDLCDRVAESVA